MVGERKPIFVYADETFLSLEGKKHIMVAAITPSSPEQMAYEVSLKKLEVGLSVFDEIKWNTRGLTPDQRNSLTDSIGMILSNGCTGFICLLEGEDKQKAIEMLYIQLSEFCQSESIPAFSLYLDVDLAPSLDKFKEYIKSSTKEQRCVAVQSVVSADEPLIQCADIFAGLLRIQILHDVEDRQKPFVFHDEYLDEDIHCNLSEYLNSMTRRIIWGKSKPRSIDIKHSMDLGFRINSSISRHVMKILKERIATTYIGCMY